MNRRTLGLSAALFAFVLLPAGAFAQDAPQQKSAPQPAPEPKPLKDQIVGTWGVILVDRIAPDGERTPLLGPNPAGQVIFDSSGHFAGLIGRNAITKFASNDRMAGTAAENKAVVQGLAGDAGKYTVNEADHTLDLRIEISTFPNWSGTRQKRSIMIYGDDLIYSADAGSGSKVEIYFRRAK